MAISGDAAGGFVWRPTQEQINDSVLADFMRRHSLATFDELLRRSTQDIEWFWNAVLDDLKLDFRVPYTRILDTSRGDPWARWCVGGRLNIVDSCIHKWVKNGRGSHPALRWESEAGQRGVMSYGQLQAEVNRMAAGLRCLGIRKGDVVGIFLPMIPEIVVGFFAIAQVGAILLPLFSGYGDEAVRSRLRAAGAKALLTADGFRRRGRLVSMKQIADRAVAEVPTLEHMIVVRKEGNETGWTAGRDHWWHDLMQDEALPAQAGSEIVDSEDFVMLIYTSGTTGEPKGAVHTHCGFPVKAAQDMAHCFDVKPEDTVYWITDMGWMMGPWLLFGTTLLGATMMIYDGAPDYPGVDRVWDLVERHKVSVLGVSPSFIRAAMQHGEEPVRRHDLSSLRVLGSTGEPWNGEPWNWLFRTVGGARLPAINYSGGTETSGGILGGNVLLPMKPTAFSAAVPGMAADVVDEEGNPVRGQAGELVIRRPWIGMTRGFWNDPERYLETYWSRFPGIWRHGDWAVIDADDRWYIPGRSDDTIKVAGKRLGPAEVESILAGHAAVMEAGCVGVPDEAKGQAVVCFCVLGPEARAGSDHQKLALEDELRWRVAQSLGKALKPREVKIVDALPRTRNGKVMRRILRAVYLGEPTGDISSLENPESIDAIRVIGRAAGRTSRA